MRLLVVLITAILLVVTLLLVEFHSFYEPIAIVFSAVLAQEKASRYYLAAVANPGGAVFGLVDPRTLRWVANLATGHDAHPVATDIQSGRVLVSIGGRACHRGCIAVYGPR